jgi:hypothetical protein
VKIMYKKICVVLLVLWFIALTTQTGGDAVHLLFITALGVLLLSLVTRPPKVSY